ncbi:MAG: hypothetical protein V4726_23740 [Verrucomicrobiota bacterium]
MKRRTKDIVVRDVKFGYGITVEDVPWPGHFRIMIWSKHARRHPKLELRFPNDLQPVTPSAVRRMIEWAIDLGWRSDYGGDTLKLEWCSLESCGFVNSSGTANKQNGESKPALLRAFP